MSDKSLPDGPPNVIYLKDELDERFGEGAARVVLPITDPYVRHHGALGGFARIYCREEASVVGVVEFAKGLKGVEAVYDKNDACAKFDLPADREGDVVVIANANTAIGSSEAEHDLSELKGNRLRSHGGLAERYVPFIVSEPLDDEYRRRSRAGTINSYEIFEYAINGT